MEEHGTHGENTGTDLSRAVASARSGDQQGFRTLYESTYRDQYYMALRYMHNEQDAADVLQDAYLSAWKHLKDLTDDAKFSSWLSSIVARTSINALKKKKRVTFEPLAGDEAEGSAFTRDEADFRREYQPEQAYTDRETSELLREMMDTLSDEQRACVMMYYIDEQPVREIADIIGCSENTVKSRLSYGRKNLKAKADELEKKGYRLLGLTAVSFLRMLIKNVFSSGAAAQAAQSAMQAQAATILAQSAVAGAQGTAGGAFFKTAAAVIGIALLGGGAYALGSGGFQAPLAPAWQAPADMGEALPGSAHPELSEEVRERFDELLSLVPENSEAKWIYVDEDDYPELLIVDRYAYAEQNMVLYRLYYGESAGEFTGLNPQTGATGQLVFSSYHDNSEHPHVQEKYYIPRGNTFIEDETNEIGETLTILSGINEDGYVAYRYVLNRRPYDVDVSSGTPQRVYLPEGEFLYYMIDISDPQMNEVQITKEQYDELIGTDTRILFTDAP